MAIPDAIATAVAEKITGSVVAPAGCGKTETIADIVAGTGGRCLLLTHTLAGVEALKKRLREKGVKSQHFQLNTIAAWCLKYASAFPQSSGLPRLATPRGQQWPAVYAAANQLVAGRTLDMVLRASYGLILVDEYQDCTRDQHTIITALSRLVPTLVFGDPMQSIFDFGGEPTVRWQEDVLPVFPSIDELQIPWRWKKLGNDDLADWLKGVREGLEAGKTLDLRTTPSCVKVHHLTDPAKLMGLEKKACNRPGLSETNRLAIIGARGSEKVRAALAKRVHAQNVETIDCKDLQTACSTIEVTTGMPRLVFLMGFLQGCIVGIDRASLIRRVAGAHQGRKVIKPLCAAETAAFEVVTSNDPRPIITLIDELRQGRRMFRGELVFALRDSLVSRCLPNSPPLLECAWHVQERRRHAGRRHGYKIVTSTLLAKGLEYENTVVFLTQPASKEDIYVALTRASKHVDIVTHALDVHPK